MTTVKTYDPMADSREMLKLYDQPFLDRPGMPATAREILVHTRLMFEEGGIEMIQASGCKLTYQGQDIELDSLKVELDDTKVPNLVAIADSIGDTLVVTYGTANVYGIDAEAIYHEVHRSNMSKVSPDGTIRKRADGKVIKPATYSPANISGVLETQHWEYLKDYLSREPDLKTTIEEGWDFHTVIAWEVEGKLSFTFDAFVHACNNPGDPRSQEARCIRSNVKYITCNLPDYIEVPTLSEKTGMRYEEASLLRDNYFDRYPKLLADGTSKLEPDTFQFGTGDEPAPCPVPMSGLAVPEALIQPAVEVKKFNPAAFVNLIAGMSKTEYDDQIDPLGLLSDE